MLIKNYIASELTQKQFQNITLATSVSPRKTVLILSKDLTNGFEFFP